MREDDYKPVIIDHMSLISMRNGVSYNTIKEYLEHLAELSKIYDVNIITGIQKQKFTLGKLKPLNIV